MIFKNNAFHIYRFQRKIAVIICFYIFLISINTKEIASAKANISNLPELYKLALKKDIEYQVAEREYERDKELFSNTKYRYFPKIYGQAEYRNSDDPMIAELYDKYDVEIQIYNRENNLEEKVNAQKRLAALIKYHQEKNELLVRTINTFLDLLKVKQRLVFENRKIELYKKQICKIETLIKAKYSSMTDRYSLKSEYFQALSQQLISYNEYETTKKNIFENYGKAINDNWIFDKKWGPETVNFKKVNIWQAFAKKNNYEIALAKSEIDAAKANIDRSRAAYAPTVELFGSVEHNTYLDNNNSSTRDAMAGIRINLVLLNKGITINKIKSSVKEFDLATIKMKAVTQTVTNKITELFLNVESHQQLLNSTEHSLEDTKKLYALLQGDESIGIEDIFRFTTVQNKVIDLEIELVDLRFEFIKLYLELKNTSGDLSKNDLTVVQNYFVPASNQIKNEN